MPHRYDPHPEKGTGYTNNEVYELRQKQRRLENDIRHLKRQREVIEAQGFDTKDIDARIRHKQAALRELVGDNDTVLQRDRWREQVADTGPYVPLGKKDVDDLGDALSVGAQKARVPNELEGETYHVDDELLAVVDGMKIVGSWKRRPDMFDFEIDDIVDAQGFDGLPRILGEEELYDAINAVGYGESGSYTVVPNRTKLIIRSPE